MPILSGKRLGPYEILSAIGAGGMGEVYRAKDTRLDRIIAIKVLPSHLADRAELRERFDREARTIASLNHPHICTLYDVGRQDGIDYLVMEYLEGETLVERLKKGPLPIEQVLKYVIEIADALDKAHRKGITHRDLKPSNILLTKSGAKLLDFGLAKLKQEATPAVSLSQRPTAESGMTAEGTILGTLQYMAPEQVEGIIYGKNFCSSCGVVIARDELIKSAKRGRIVAQGPEAQARRAETQRRNATAQYAWKESDHPVWLTEETYRREIQPRLANVAVSVLMSALSVCESYAADIRRGRRRPHARHWDKLARLIAAQQNPARDEAACTENNF